MSPLINARFGLAVVAVMAVLAGPSSLNTKAEAQHAAQGDVTASVNQPKSQPADLGLELMPNGPIHEAYAQPSAKNREAPVIVKKQPPEPIQEQPPDQKTEGKDVQWIPGYWDWSAEKNDFVWVSGLWRIPPPDRKWVPGYWTQVDGGSRRVAGFWGPAEEEQATYQPQPPASLDVGPSYPAADNNSFYLPGSWIYGADGYRWRPGYWYPCNSDYVWTPACYQWTPAGFNFVNGFWDFPVWNRGLLFAPVFFNRPFFANSFFQPSSVLAFNFFFPFHRFFSVNPFLSSRIFNNTIINNTVINNTIINNTIINNINNFNRFPRVVTPLGQFHSTQFQLTKLSTSEAAAFRTSARQSLARGVERSQFEARQATAINRGGVSSRFAGAGSATAANRRLGWSGEPRSTTVARSGTEPNIGKSFRADGSLRTSALPRNGFSMPSRQATRPISPWGRSGAIVRDPSTPLNRAFSTRLETPSMPSFRAPPTRSYGMWSGHSFSPSFSQHSFSPSRSFGGGSFHGGGGSFHAGGGMGRGGSHSGGGHR
jgi:hypothetical protein